VIDTHCHLTFPELHDRLDDVLAAANRAGVDRMISIGTTPESSRHAADLAASHGHVFATAGIHPHEAGRHHDRNALLDPLREMLALPGVVALGEMGLDTHYPDPPLADQKRVFAWQLELATDHPDLPVVIHNRKAIDDTLAMLRDTGLPGERFVFHCFTGTPAEVVTGTPAEVDAILDFGACVGFTGVVTFKSAADVAEASDRVPLERMFVETDAPFLTPEPHRKVRPNEPCYVPHVAAFLAERRGVSVDDFTAAVDANAERFFGLPLRE
jgi:TatD DNase family protein